MAAPVLQALQALADCKKYPDKHEATTTVPDMIKLGSAAVEYEVEVKAVWAKIHSLSIE